MPTGSRRLIKVNQEVTEKASTKSRQLEQRSSIELVPLLKQPEMVAEAVNFRIESMLAEVLLAFKPHVQSALLQNRCSPYLIISIGIMDRFPCAKRPAWLTEAAYEYLRVKFTGKEKRARSGPRANPEKSSKRWLAIIRCAFVYELVKEVRKQQTITRSGKSEDLVAEFYEFSSAYDEQAPAPKTIRDWLNQGRPIIKPLMAMEDPPYHIFDVPFKEIVDWLVT